MGIASLTGRIGNMVAPFTATVVGIMARMFKLTFCQLLLHARANFYKSLDVDKSNQLSNEYITVGY